LRLLREHPEWRDDVRREVLGDELLMLPDLVRQNSEDIRDLTAAVALLTDGVSQLTTDVGGLKGDSLELWYRFHPGVLSLPLQLRKPSVADVESLELVEEAYDAGTLTAEQLDSLHDADLVGAARRGTGDQAGDAVLVSRCRTRSTPAISTVASDRAAILSSVGLPGVPRGGGPEHQPDPPGGG
jgi:hypothetical protein